MLWKQTGTHGGGKEDFFAWSLRFQSGLCSYQALSRRACCSVIAPGSHNAPALGQDFFAD